MIINTNQTSIILILGKNDLTYELKSFKQVLIYEKDKKHAFTYITSVIRIRQILTI